MTIVRRKRESTSVAVATRPHIGFTERGSIFHSAEPVENQFTGFVSHLLWKIRTEFLSPRDVVAEIGAQSETLRRIITLQTIGRWVMLDRFWDWPVAGSTNSAEETLCSFGGRYPYLKNPKIWDEMCSMASYKHGYRRDVVRVNMEDHEVGEGGFSVLFGRLFGRPGSLLDGLVMDGVDRTDA